MCSTQVCEFVCLKKMEEGQVVNTKKRVRKNVEKEKLPDARVVKMGEHFICYVCHRAATRAIVTLGGAFCGAPCLRVAINKADLGDEQRANLEARELAKLELTADMVPPKLTGDTDDVAFWDLHTQKHGRAVKAERKKSKNKAKGAEPVKLPAAIFGISAKGNVQTATRLDVGNEGRVSGTAPIKFFKNLFKGAGDAAGQTAVIPVTSIDSGGKTIGQIQVRLAPLTADEPENALASKICHFGRNEFEPRVAAYGPAVVILTQGIKI